MQAMARTTDPETSHMAAASVSDLRHSQYLVLKVLRKLPSRGMTDEELQAEYLFHRRQRPALFLAQSESGIRTRRSELVRLGLVEFAGERRRMDSGRMARVWRIKK